MQDTIEVIKYPCALIDPSPYQVREKFEPQSIAELSASLKEHGVIQPLTARVSPQDPGRLELVAGERRLRAAKLAELPVVPVIVHELSDRAAQEIVLIENLQREDLTVSEEARGYRKALDLRDDEGKPLYTQASLAQKIGKPLNHVADRLKLLLCPEILVAAVEANVVALSTAMLVGRIPDPKAREIAAKRVLKPEIQEVPLNYEQTREMIRAEFMVSLQRPGFDKEDATLVPVVMDGETRVMGGSCLDCPHRSDASDQRARNSAPVGNAGVELKQGGANDLCTLPSCFKKKQAAAWKILAQQAEAQNVRVIQGDGAREIFSRFNQGLNHDAPYVLLDAKPDYDDVGASSYDNKKTFRSLLKGADVEIVIARHPVTGQRVELAEKRGARLVAKAKLKGKDVAEEIKTTEDAERAKKEQRAEEIRAAKLEAITLHEGLTDLAEAISRKGMDADQLDYLFQLTLDNSGADGFKFMKDWLGLKMPKGTANSPRDYEDEILKTIRARATTPQQWLGYIVAASLSWALRWSGLKDDDLQHFWQLYGIQKEQLERRARAILDAGTKEKKVETGPNQTEMIAGVQDAKQGRCGFVFATGNETAWARALIEMDLRATLPNEAGVFEDCAEFSIPMLTEKRSKETGRPIPMKGCALKVLLATDDEGLWYAGLDWHRNEPAGEKSCALGGGYLPSLNKVSALRVEAVWGVLSELVEEFCKLGMEAMEGLVDAAMQSLVSQGKVPASVLDGFSQTGEGVIAQEKDAEQLSFEEQVQAVAKGAKPSEFIGTKPDPKKDPEGYKQWDAKRKKLVRAAQKLEA